MSAEPSLNDLVNQFRALQKQEFNKKLNDRNAVEIINVLLSRKLIELVFTTNGQGYLTREQVVREVRDEVSIAGGRINTVDLPNLLHVDMGHIERAVKELSAEDPEGFLEVGGEIITTQYIDFLIREAQSWLREAGRFTITEFAKKFLLSVGFVTDRLERAVREGVLSAVINEDTLYTAAFVAAQRRKLLCALVGCAGMANIQSLQERHHILPSLASKLTTSVLEKELKHLGHIESANYIPTHLEAGRTQRIKSSLMMNKFITYDSLRSEGFSNIKAFLTKTFNPPVGEGGMGTPATSTAGGKGNKASKGGKGKSKASAMSPTEENAISAAATPEYPYAGHALSNCFLADTYFETLSDKIEQLVAGEEVTALAIAPLLPHCVSLEKDADTIQACLDRHFPKLAESCVLVKGYYYINSKSVQNLFAETRTALIANNITDKGMAQREVMSRLKKLFAGDSKKARSSTADEDALSKEEAEELAETIFEQNKGQIDEILSEISKSKKQREASSIKELQQNLSAMCLQRWLELNIATKGLSWVASNTDEATLASIQKGLLNDLCLPIVSDLFVDVSFDKSDVRAWCEANKVVALEPAPASKLKEGIKLLPKEMTGTYKKLLDEATGTGKAASAETFMNSLSEACGEGSVSLSCFHSPNKKSEREAQANWVGALTSRLAKSSFSDSQADVGELFADLVAAVLATNHRVYIRASGKAVSGIVAGLKEQELTDALALVIRHLSKKGDLTSEERAQLEKVKSKFVLDVK